MTKKKGGNFQKRMNIYSTFGRVFVYENWQVAVVLGESNKKDSPIFRDRWCHMTARCRLVMIPKQFHPLPINFTLKQL